MRLHSFIEKHLLKRTGISYLLYPLSLLYRVGHRIKQGRDLSRQYRAPYKVISIGNLTAGGSGKTPLGLELARLLSENGYRVAVSHRGYKGNLEKETVLLDSEMELSPKILGDEACLYASSLKDIPIVIGRDRVEAARLLQQKKPDTQVLILDDSFQNKKLHHDIDIVVVSAEMGLGNGFCLPAGYLREPLSSLKKGHYVVLLSKNGRTPGEALVSQLRSRTERIYFADLVPGELKAYNGEPTQKEELTGKKLLLVSGIGNPASFEETVCSLGLEWIKHLRYPDHYSFDDVSEINREASDYILCTQKDVIKLALHNELRGKLVYIELGLKWKNEGFVRDLLASIS